MTPLMNLPQGLATDTDMHVSSSVQGTVSVSVSHQVQSIPAISRAETGRNPVQLTDGDVNAGTMMMLGR